MTNESIRAAFERFWFHVVAKIGDKANVDHTHDIYETKADASNKLAEAKSYADNAATKVKNDLLNGAGAAYDTLQELGELIDDNHDAIDALNTVAAGKQDKESTQLILKSSDEGSNKKFKITIGDDGVLGVTEIDVTV